MAKMTPVRDWMFRALMFESHAESFRSSGIGVGADQFSVEQSLFEETLSPFPLTIRNGALRMARLYSQFFCFEASVRELVIERLAATNPLDWWEQCVPNKVKEYSDKRRADAESNSWLSGESAGPLDYLLFGHLADVIVANWDQFSDIIPSQHWMKQRLDELEKVRNFVAHNRVLSASEFRRVELYLDDWDRQVGF